MPEDEISERYARRERLYLLLDAKLLRPIDASPKVKALRRAAWEAMENADCDTASVRLTEARAVLRAAPEPMVRQEAMVLEEVAEVAMLHGDFAAAVTARREAAALVGFDPEAVWTFTLDEGNALFIWGSVHGDPMHVREAVAAFRRALALVPKATVGKRWVITQGNLGSALLHLGERGDDAALRGAAAARKAVLRSYTRKRSPTDWAEAQHSLGTVLAILGERGDETALRGAVAAFAAALTVPQAEHEPNGWAVTQSNLGNALHRLGERGDDAALGEAVAAYRVALAVWTRDRTPIEWATTQSHLGDALVLLAERHGNDAALREAVAAYEAALTIQTPQHTTRQWIGTQDNLGTALCRLGVRGDETALRRAIAALSEVLTVLARDQAPADWAHAQHNLGNALAAFGERHKDDAVLCKAVAAYEAALTVPTHKGWARTTENLAMVRETQGARGGGAARFVEAFALADAALAEYQREGSSHDIDTATVLLNRLRATLAPPED